MSPSPKKIDAITLFVENPQTSKGFYERVFGVPTIYEDENSAVVEFENTIVNLLALPAAQSLIAPGLVGVDAAGSRFQLTVSVPDVDAMCEELTAGGVTLLNGPMDRAWGLRTACLTDPDGHVWEIAHALGGGSEE